LPDAAVGNGVLLTSTFLNLVVVPVLFVRRGEPADRAADGARGNP
jgi:hypothetical protein